MALDIQLYLFVAGYLVEHIGNGIMIYKLNKQKTMYGISIETQICLMCTTLARVLWMWDTSLTKLWISLLEITAAVAMHAFILFQCYSYKDTVYKGIKNPFLKSPVLISICAVLSILIHPGSKGKYFFTLQMLVSFTMFLEALALLPQLEHLRSNRDREGLTSNYLFCLGGSRAVRFFFWIAMITNDDSFWYLILADFIHTVLLVVFFYEYRVVLKGGESILGFTNKNKFK